MPEVSVIVPAYNAADTLARCLWSALRQDWAGDWEVVVVDDGSTDATPDVVERLAREAPRPVRLIRQANAGAGGARNRGAAEACAPAVAFCDADDTWRPEMLSSCAGVLGRRGVQAVLAGFVVHSEAGERSEVRTAEELAGISEPLDGDSHLLSPDTLVAYLKGAYFGNDDALLIRREALREVGGFPEGYAVGEDFLLWVRLLSRLKVAYVSRPLADVHQGGGSRSRRDMETTWENIVAILERFGSEAALWPAARRAWRWRLGTNRMSLAISRWRKGKPWVRTALKALGESRRWRHLRAFAGMCLRRPGEVA
jgi:glycosyltransferase involved in cell wall biosynthesis